MKQLTLIILSVFGLWMTISSQTSKTFNLSDFSNKDWYAVFPPDSHPKPVKQGWNFSPNGEVTSFMYWDNEKKTAVVNFYLSDTIVTEFDHSKVGKTPKGKYIVTLNKANYINNLEIISIAPNRLTLKNLYYKNIIEFSTTWTL